MKAGVIGLGTEGKKASQLLIKEKWDVYATDLEIDIDLEDLEIAISDANIHTEMNKISINTDKISIDLGYMDKNAIYSCDAVVISPSAWNSKIAKEIKESGKLICDVLNKHRKTYTIGVTGTNGKTTTSTMIKEILENAGKKVLIGGNAGGGFQGYCEIFLKAEKEDYDVIIVEVCDMTLDYCKYSFDFDLIALTNIGNDHLNVHGSIENYKSSLTDFFKNQNVVVNENEEDIDDFEKIAIDLTTYGEFKYELNVIGKFNRLNAGLAATIASYLDIAENTVKDSLKDFEAVEGRLKKFKLNDSDIYIGKTDNSDAIKSILDEKKFYATFIGTPRHSEEHRLDILDEVSKSNPEIIVLFPGLEDTIELGVKRLQKNGYKGQVKTARNIDEIIKFIADYSHEESILIGGNGQEIIVDIQNRLKFLTGKCG